jgi:hypothetical protein
MPLTVSRSRLLTGVVKPIANVVVYTVTSDTCADPVGSCWPTTCEFLTPDIRYDAHALA